MKFVQGSRNYIRERARDRLVNNGSLPKGLGGDVSPTSRGRERSMQKVLGFHVTVCEVNIDNILDLNEDRISSGSMDEHPSIFCFTDPD